jgi:hypothetical protein
MAKNANGTQSMVQEQKGVQWVKGQNDDEFKNSVGFFRDPFTGKEFGDAEINAPRVEGHKYAHILASDGKTAIPLSSRFWTRQEKDDYNNSRKNGSSGSTTRSSGSTKNEELRKGLTALKDYLAANNKMDNKIEGFISALMPADPEVEKMQKKVANMSEEQKALLKSLLG